MTNYRYIDFFVHVMSTLLSEYLMKSMHNNGAHTDRMYSKHDAAKNKDDQVQ